MIRIVLTLAALASLSTCLLAQRVESPKDVVERLWKIDTVGDRLTQEGRHKAAEMFERRSPAPSPQYVTIMKGNFVVGGSQIEGNKAQVGVEYLKLGTVDPSMRFVWSSPSGPIKERDFYNLVLDKSHVWKISGSQAEPVISVKTAIQYVTDTRNKSTDNTLRKNADTTLKLLKSQM